MIDADPDLVATALASATAAGPYFTLSLGDSGPDWVAADAFYRDGLAGLIARTGTQLGVTESRVAASTVQLGYAARLWSPVLSSALRHGVVPDLAGLRVAARPALRLSLPEPRGWQSGRPAELAALVYRTVISTHLEPLTAGLQVKVAPGLLHGNAAAAMTGALRVLVAIDPVMTGPARALAAILLSSGALRGTGELTGPGLEFRRRSCCLFYRVPRGGLCGDCPLPGP